LMREVGG